MRSQLRATGPVWAVALVAVLVVPSGRAAAQYAVPAAVSTEARVGSARSRYERQLVRAAGWELGASLNFLTSDDGLGGLAFTDLVLLRAHGLISLGGHTELFGGVDLLPKQPSDSSESVFQGALAGIRVRLGDRYAVWARGQGGPQLGGNGHWAEGDIVAQYKRALAADVLYWESGLGGTFTTLLGGAVGDDPTWLAEVACATGVALREPTGHFGTWLSFGFHFPVAQQSVAGVLDPQTRVNLALGVLVGISKTVDLFIEWSILDRGDGDAPATRLPILGGGFDQRQFVFGFMRRFDKPAPTRRVQAPVQIVEPGY